MFNVGSGEILVILLVALIVVGPAQLPKLARQVGNAMNEVRRVSTGFQRELTSALEMEEQRQEKATSPGGPRDLRPAAAAPPPADRGPDDPDPDGDLDTPAADEDRGTDPDDPATDTPGATDR